MNYISTSLIICSLLICSCSQKLAPGSDMSNSGNTSSGYSSTSSAVDTETKTLESTSTSSSDDNVETFKDEGLYKEGSHNATIGK